MARVRMGRIALCPAYLLFYELHLHECAPILVGDPFLGRDEVHRQDVPILLCTALAFLVVPEQAAISGNVGTTPLVEE